MTDLNPIQQLSQLGQSVWFDNIRRGFIKSGEMQRLIDLGVLGLTSNPSIFQNAISGSDDYDEALRELASSGLNAEQIYEALVIEDIQSAADLLRPVFDRTNGLDGYASLEPSPHLANDTEGTIAEVHKQHAALNRPNVMIKVPGTPAGIKAISQLLGEGININVTLIFSLDLYSQVREAYIAGLETFAASGGDISKVRSVASFFVSRVDTAVDGQLNDLIQNGNEGLSAHISKAAIANAKLAYRDFKDTFSSDRFEALRAQGAQVQRPLWASTSTKNPELSDVLYVETLVGNHTVNTMPDATLNALLDHGVAEDTIERDVADADATISAIEGAGISMKDVTDGLLAAGVKSFSDAYDSLLENIETKRSQLAETTAADD